MHNRIVGNIKLLAAIAAKFTDFIWAWQWGELVIIGGIFGRGLGL